MRGRFLVGLFVFGMLVITGSSFFVEEGMGQAAEKGEVLTVRCPVVADSGICAHRDEVNANWGGGERIRIKGIEHLALFKFDLSRVRGMTVESAEFYVRRAKVKLSAVGLSTIPTEWREGKSRNIAPEEGASCFNFAAYSTDKEKIIYWAGPGSDFTDATFSQAGSLYHFTYVKEEADDWYSIDVPPEMVAALANGRQQGLVLSDEKGQTRTNNEIYAKESKSPPYFLVRGRFVDKTPPEKITGVATDSSSAEAGVLILSWQAPRDEGRLGRALSYDLKFSKKPINADNWEKAAEVPRYLIPRPGPVGSKESLKLQGLEPGVRYYFGIRALDEAGNASEITFFSATASVGTPRPRLAAHWEEAVEPGRVRDIEAPEIWAIGDGYKVNPLNGNLIEDGDEIYAGEPSGTHRLTNDVWDAQEKRISLFGARNEFVAFQIVIEAEKGEFEIQASDLKGPGQIPGENIVIFREWYVKGRKDKAANYYGDPLVPISGKLSIPDKANPVAGQRNQALFADIYIPHKIPPGDYTGTISIREKGGRLSENLKINLEVLALTLPDEISFIVDLNSYGGIGGLFGVSGLSDEYLTIEERYHRLTHAHRATLNILGYSQSGAIKDDYAPPLEGSGKNIRVKDWKRWDKHFGRYLDGSSFKDMPRRGVPLTHMYLPFHENYPADIRKYYTPAERIEDSFPQVYKDEIVKICQEFARHFREKGWARTKFQLLLNNKYYYKRPERGGRGSSWWLLDEPMHRDDFLALRFYGRLFKQGFKEKGAVKVVFRCDISRPQWQRETLDGLLDLSVVSRAFYSKHPLIMRRREKFGEEYWNYSTANSPEASNINARAWAWTAWLNYGDGVLPWNTIGKAGSWDRADPLAVLYPGARVGYKGPMASMRLKAFRRGQQDMEYLNLLAKKRPWSREYIRLAVLDSLKLIAETKEAYEDDAGIIVFKSLSSEPFEDIKRLVAQEILR